MSTTSEQMVGRAVADAAARIAVPDESRWIPEPRSSATLKAALVVIATAVVIIAGGIGLRSFREQRVVPAQPTAPFTIADDAAWAQIRSALPSDAVVLRPTWIPAEFAQVGISDCPTPVGVPILSDRGYDFNYRAGKFIDVQRNPGAPGNAGGPPSCAKVEIRRNAFQVSPSLTDVGTVNERATIVRVRTGPKVFDTAGKEYQLIYFNWTEDGSPFELSTLDVDMTDALRILRSLEPMR